ncbi:hypothetical protein ACIXT9_02140 [Bacteroides fragilis]
MVDFRTEKQKQLDKRNESICNDYLSFSTQPGATPNGVYRKIAEKYGKTISGVIYVLKKQGYLTSSN